MAQIDHSIYFQSKPADFVQAMKDGVGMRQQFDQQQQQKQDLNKKKQIDEAYRSSYSKNPDGSMSFDQGMALSKLAGIEGAGQDTFQAQQQFQQMDQAKQKQDMEKKLQQLQMTGQLIGGAKDQNSWSAARQKAQGLGMDVSQVPEFYDPGIQRQMMYANMTTAQQLDHQLKQQNLGLQREELNLKKQEMNSKLSGPGAKLSEGQKKVDTEYAKDYNDFTGGGESKAVKSLEKLKEYKKLLESESKNIFSAGGGPISGSMPDMFRTQDSIALRDNIMNEANAGLKATFGGQLSDGERKSAASEYYNDKLDAGQNAKILDRKIAELEGSIAAQKAKATHYEQNRSSLSGYGKVRSELSQSPTSSPNKKTYSWALTSGE